MLNRLQLQHFILFGLLAWGLPGIFLGGFQIFCVVAAVSIPVWVSMRKSQRPRTGAPRSSLQNYGRLVAILGAYLFLDAILGRQKFAQNLFFSTSAVTDFIESANAGVSQGRGVIDLLGAVAIFAPFALFDYAKGIPRQKQILIYIFVTIFIVYEIGISRGYLLMATASILIGAKINVRSLVIASVASLTIFTLASYARGDFGNVTLSNPLFDAVGWPYINLSMLMGKNLGGGSSIDFLLEFFKKFLPSFVHQKEIFSFNVEMTKILYPGYSDYIESVSIFTYLGELLYYKPTILTAGLAGSLLALLGRFIERMLSQNGLNSTRVFTGLMCIVLLRSRVQDVLSFLIFLVIFLIIWRLILQQGQGRADQVV